MNFLTGLLTIVNRINSNVWAFIVLLVGVFLVIKGEKASGESLITGGFALLRSTVGSKEDNNNDAASKTT